MRLRQEIHETEIKSGLETLTCLILCGLAGSAGLEWSGGWGLGLYPPVHVYRHSFLSENQL